MIFNFEDPHTVYIIAAYAVAAVGYGALVLHTICKCCAIKKMEQPR